MEPHYYPFSVPNFDTLFEEVVAYVRKHQGEKGYIDTQDGTKDTIYTFNFDELGDAYEAKVHGVRVVNYKDGYDLEVVTEPIMRTYQVVYDEETFQGRCESEPEANAEWESVRWSEMPYVHTLLQIAENIEEYV